MLSRAARALPLGLRALQQSQASWASPILSQQAASYSEQVNLSDRETLKKFVGIEDLLGRDPDARGTLKDLLQQLRDAVSALPADADYRRAVEATVAYRLKVLEANDSDAAAEEVLDSHLEELILEAREELNLVPILAEQRPWDVPSDHATPVYDYAGADAVLGGSAGGGGGAAAGAPAAAGGAPPPPPPPPPK